jgi:beta-carotene hydroxylase
MNNPTPARTASSGDHVSTTIDESEIIRRNTGFVAWPTVALCIGLVASYTVVVVGSVAGPLPLWAGFILNTALSYAFYTVHHEANHKAISGRQAGRGWLDTVCGSIAAIPLQLSFKGWSAEHIRHHAHTNEPGKDPDYQVAGPLWAVPLKWLMAVTFSSIGALPYGDRLVGRILTKLGIEERSSTNERVILEHKRLRRYNRVCLAALIITIPLGLFVPALLLWWLPGRVAVLGLMVLFQWLPHVPYDDTARFRNTRITTFRGSTFLLLQQDRHLIHHLHPFVPWYRYHSVFREMRPLLEANGARIEGRDSVPHQPIQLAYKTLT